MRNERKINLANCDFDFQNKNSLNTNEAKACYSNLQGNSQTVKQPQKVRAASHDSNGNLRTVKQAHGITLIALVVTIVVLLILARSKYFNGTWE